MNQLKIFENAKFGQMRTVDVGGKIYFVAKDVATALGYSNTKDAILRHCKGVVKRDLLTKGGKQLMNVIPEGDIYRLVAHSELPAAQEFECWIFDEVLPSIRKTGTYIIPKEKPNKIKEQEVEARLRNARVRESNQYLKIAAQIGIPEYKYILQSKAAETLAGKPLLPMQEAERKTYSATEIGEKFGVSKNMIGKVANANGLKTPEYGKLFYSKSEHSVKEVETWRYYDNAIPVFAKLLNKGVA